MFYKNNKLKIKNKKKKKMFTNFIKIFKKLSGFYNYNDDL
jgi:hypothetical protein